MYLATLPWVKLQDPATFYHRPSSLLHCTDMLLLFLLQDVAHLCEKAQNLATWPEREVVGGFRSCDRWFFYSLSILGRRSSSISFGTLGLVVQMKRRSLPVGRISLSKPAEQPPLSIVRTTFGPLLHSETKISSGRRRSSPTEMPLPMRKEWRSSQTTCTKVAYCGPINQCLFVDNNPTDFPSDEGFQQSHRVDACKVVQFIGWSSPCKDCQRPAQCKWYTHVSDGRYALQLRWLFYQFEFIKINQIYGSWTDIFFMWGFPKDSNCGIDFTVVCIRNENPFMEITWAQRRTHFGKGRNDLSDAVLREVKKSWAKYSTHQRAFIGGKCKACLLLLCNQMSMGV